MGVIRVVLAAWLLAVAAGCAAPAAVAPRAEAAEVVLEGTALFVEAVGDGDESPGTFLPSGLWDEGAGASVAEIVLVGRNSRRGGGPGARRPPPLLNPRPGPESPRYWARRTADPKVVARTRQLYYQRLAEAQARYPNASGYQNHHAVPLFLGGQGSGTTYRLPTAYHQAITQEFRREWGYGRIRKPESRELLDIMMRVYGKYPIPQLVGIEP
jgi:hypothetical protein